jgi:putative membrane protein
VLAVVQGPFDRRHGMATLVLDTAGADATAPALRVRYLPEDDARALRDRLAMAVSPK